MRGEEEIRHFKLQQCVMGLSNIRNYQVLAKLFANAVDKKVIVKTKNSLFFYVVQKKGMSYVPLAQTVKDFY